MKEYLDKAGLQEYTEKLVTKLKTIFPGQPLVAATAADMTDTSRIYVYRGTETGYTAGDWYYYDTTSGTWESGGPFISGGIETDTTLSVPGMAADAKAAGDAIRANASALDNKANVDGSYESMTVGNAEQLVSTVGVEDQVPYNFRASGGGADIGDRETDMIVGGTVAWNQSINGNSNFSASSGATITPTVDRVATFTASASGQQAYKTTQIQIKGHVYLAAATYKTSVPTTDVALRAFGLDKAGSANTEWQTVYRMRKSDTVSATSVGVKDNREANWDAIQVKEFQFFDLTQMFGPTIADYINSLEQANAGDGVAWFRRLFPNDYYAFDPGTLRSVQTSAHKMVGFNAFDKNASDVTLGKYLDANGAEQSQSNSNITGYIPVIGGKTYYFANAANGALGRYMFWYDSGKNIISGGLIPYLDGRNVQTAPANARYVRVSVRDELWDTYVVNLSWDGERDGEYEPYQAWNYPLDDSLTLRGVPTLDANNKLRYDGDTYESDGTVTRRYASVDMGTIAWSYNSTDSVFAQFTNRKLGSQLGVCTGLTQVAANTAVGEMKYGEYKLYGTSNSVAVKVEGITNSNASEKLSGIYLLYELATPTTESADPYTNPQIVDDFGTEEYVDAGVEAGARDVAIPVGHETFYQANLRAKLEAAPDSPDGDGDYLLRQINGENVYVPLVVLDELPEAPSTDGTYVLQVTVADGEPTYSWVSAT